MNAAAPPAISVRHLWHSFGKGYVLEDVSFSVQPGEIFGFIGPNGAGKTTTIRTLATLLEPSAGVVEVDGIDVTLDPLAIRRILGYMPDHAGVYDRLTVYEYLEFFASGSGASPGVVDAVLELTDLGALRDKLVASFSKGMRQRLQLARVLLHDPKVLVLDEPASDLDPRARIEIRDLLLELRRLGKTILVSSHILSELSDVCTSVGIIEKGRLLVAGPIGDIAGMLQARAEAARPAESALEPPTSSSSVQPEGPKEPSRSDRAAAVTPDAAATEATLRTGAASTPDGSDPSFDAPATPLRRLKIRILGDATAALPVIGSAPPVTTVEAASGGWLVIHHRGNDRFVADTIKRLVLADIPIVAVEPERNELERIFLEVTKGRLQ